MITDIAAGILSGRRPALAAAAGPNERGANVHGWWAASYLVLWVLVLVLALVVVSLARQLGALNARAGFPGASNLRR